MPTRDAVIDILRQRHEHYGDPRLMCLAIAKKWRKILMVPVADWQVAACMAALKEARLEVTPDHADSILDREAYLMIMRVLLGQETLDETTR